MGSVQHHTAALGADVEDVAPTCPQKFFHASLEGGQLFLGDKGLDGAGKATSVDPDGPSALQQLPPDGQARGMACCRGSATDQVFCRCRAEDSPEALTRARNRLKSLASSASASSNALRSSA